MDYPKFYAFLDDAGFELVDKFDDCDRTTATGNAIRRRTGSGVGASSTMSYTDARRSPLLKIIPKTDRASVVDAVEHGPDVDRPVAERQRVVHDVFRLAVLERPHDDLALVRPAELDARHDGPCGADAIERRRC